MSFSYDSPLPSTSSPCRENNPTNNFDVELGSFLVSLSRTEDMSSLEQQLRRLKVAWREEVERTGESGEDSDNISSIGSPQSESPGRTSDEMELSGSTSPSSSGETTTTTRDDSSTSPSNSGGEANSSSNSGGALGDTGGNNSNSRLIKFSVQRGARFDLKEEQLKEVFSKFGELVRYRLYRMTSDGFDGLIEFVSGDIARSLVNTLVEVGDCELHCSQPWESLTSQPVPHQILLESRYLPNVWERDMILRSFFSKYGVVTGVSMLGFTPGKLLRYVISFKDPNPAMNLIGSWVKILSSTVWVREVTSQTIPVNTRRFPRSEIPWRK